MGKPAPYHLLSAADKERQNRDKMREPAIRCPNCETALQTVDMFDHLDKRCSGLAAPHPCSRWATWSEAMALGVSESTLHGWVDRGLVQCRGGRRKRRYLLRDIARLVALRALWARTKEGAE